MMRCGGRVLNIEEKEIVSRQTGGEVDFEEIRECVACASVELKPVLNLGNQPLANSYSKHKEIQKQYPLELMVCLRCFHSQLSISVNPNILFADYAYVSSTSSTMRQYFKKLQKRIVDERGETGKILDIGSNDGTFLSQFNQTSWKKLGVDPAVNLIPYSLENKVITIPYFFDKSVSNLIASDFDVVVAMNVFAHTSNPLEILEAISQITKKDATVYIQTSQANMFIDAQFDTIYHEHISFFNVKSFRALANRAGFYLENVEIVPVHGNSYLWTLSKESKHTQKLEREEFEFVNGIYEIDTYETFPSKVEKVVTATQEIINNFKKLDYLVCSYGAAAKGNTFINYAGIQLDFIFDETKEKIGKFSPAGGCVVSEPTRMTEIDRNLLILIPAWNFKTEIVDKIKKFRFGHKDSILTYYPEMELINL